MKKTFFFLAFYFPMMAFSQIQTITNQKTFGTSFMEENYVGKVFNNNVYLFVTPTSSGISQDKTVPGFGNRDGWFVKMDMNFNKLDEFVFGGLWGDIGEDFVACDNGDFILLLQSNSDPAGNKTSPLYGISDFWVVRINASGNIIWQESYGGLNQDTPIELIKINENKFLIFGESQSGISGNKTVPVQGPADIWSIFIDGQGNVLNQFNYGGSGSEGLGDVSYSGSNNIISYIVKSTSGISGDRTLPSVTGFSDVWVLNTDTLGNILHQQAFGGESWTFTDPVSIEFVGNNRIFAIMQTEGNIGGNKTVAGFGDFDAWVVEMDLELNILSQHAYGGSNFDGPISTLVDGNNLLISLVSSSDVSGNKTEPHYGEVDNWYICIDPNGTILWQKSAGGALNDNGKIIEEIASNEFIIVGSSFSGVSGNKTVPFYASGLSDLWLFKLNTTLSVAFNQIDQGLIVSPNPFYETVTFSWTDQEDPINIEITDINGKVLYHQKAINMKQSFWSAENYPSGIYFYKVETSSGMSQGKILKQ